MLLHFKTEPGDGIYLIGTYLVRSQSFDITGLEKNKAHSIFCDKDGNITTMIGLPTEDDVHKVYIGSVIISEAEG